MNDSTSIKAVPTLSSSGWVTEPSKMITRLLTYYVSSNPHQTLLFKGYVVSLQSTIALSLDDSQLIESVQDDLTGLFTRYFPEGVNVSVSLGTEEIKQSLIISASVIKDGKSYDLLNSILNTENSFINFTGAYRVSSIT